MNNKFFIVMPILIILLGASIEAFGISYIFGNPEPLEIGTSKDIYLTLQNNAEPDKNYTVKAEVADDTGIAKIIDSSDIYFVPYHMPVKVNIRLTAPENAKVGENYTVKIRLNAATGEGSQALGFAVGSGQAIPITIVGPPATESKTGNTELKQEALPYSWLIYAVIIVLVILIVILTIKKRDHKK